MGHIELAAPVTHIWYFKGVPSRLGYLLDLAPKDLEKIIYFASYVITDVDAEARHRDLTTIENEIAAEKRQAENARDAEIEKRAAKLEADLAELEAEGAKSDVRRKVMESGEREMRQIRTRRSGDRPAGGGARHLPQAGAQAADHGRDALPGAARPVR